MRFHRLADWLRWQEGLHPQRIDLRADGRVASIAYFIALHNPDRFGGLLASRGLWDGVMVNDLKYYAGSVQPISRIPDELKALYASAFEIDPRWLVEAGSRRQKWIDQAQSLNLYMAEPSGKKLDNLYKLAWVRGLKTTYYLRSMGATHVEKSTLDDSSKANKLSAVGGSYGGLGAEDGGSAAPKACSILDPDCEACQ